MSSRNDTQALWASLKKGHGVWQEKHEKATKLSEEYQRVLKEEKDAQDRWHSDIIQYARTECLKISDLMYRKLPQELRDCIYQYLCIEERHILVGPYYHLQAFDYQYTVQSAGSSNSTAVRAESPMDDFSEDNRVSVLPDGRLREEYTDKPPTDMLMPNAYIFNSKYMGKIIASEALRYYYSNNIFSVCDVNHGIKMFLDPKEVASYEEDPRHQKQFDQMRHSYSLGVKPLDSVRDLQIRLKFEHFDKLLEHAMPDAGEAESHAFERHFLGKVRTSLRILRSLPETSRPLNVEFILMTALYRRPDWQDKMSSLFTNILQTIRNLVYEFMHDRVNTTVKVVHNDGFISPFPRNLTGLWSLTKEQWQYEADANGPKPEWTANSYITPPHPWHLQVLGGVPISQFQELLRKRWGIEDVFKDTKPKWPITESDYWPVIIRKNVGWK